MNRFALASILLAAACGDNHCAPIDPSAGPTLQEAAELAGAAACERIFRCQPQPPFPSVDACVASYVAQACEFCVTTGNGRLCTPLDCEQSYGASYEELEACVAQYERIDCTVIYVPRICTL